MGIQPRVLRRVLVGGMVAVPCIAAVGAAAWWLPQWVSKKAQDAIRQRLGVQTHVKRATMGATALTLEHVRAGDERSAVRLELGRLRVGFNPAVALFDPEGSIREIRVRDMSVDVAVDDDGFASVIDGLRPQPSGDGEAEERQGETSRDFDVRNLSFRLHDARGELVRVQGKQLRYEQGMLTLELEGVSVGQRPSSTASLAAITARADRSEEGLRLREARIGRAEVVLGLSGAAAQSKTEKNTRTLGRLQAVARRLRTGTDTEPGDGRAADGGDGAIARRLLSPDVSLELSEARIRSRSTQGVGTVLSHLQASVKGDGPGELQLRGSGQEPRGGELNWDLRLWPDEWRGDGRIALDSLPLTLLAPLLPDVPWHEPEHSTIDAELVLEAESVQRIAVQGRARLANAAVYAERIAPTPVHDVGFTLQGQGHWLPLERHLEIEQAQVLVDGVKASLQGAIELTAQHYMFDVSAQLPSTNCTDVVHAIPEDLLGEMRNAQWAGQMSGALHVRVDSRKLEDTALEIDIRDRCEFVAVPAMADLRRFRMPFVHEALEPSGEVFELRTGPGTEQWVYLEEVSPFFVHAVLAHEDVRFFSHSGFAPGHIRNALVRNLQAGRYVLGASTITMQLAKNVFLRREKTLARKVQEVLLTWWLERFMDKRDILELYLNVIEYGPSVYGIRHAAEHYFGRTPAELSPAESVYLSTILPNPKRYHSHYDNNRLPAHWRQRMLRIFERMRSRGWYTPEAVAYGKEELQDFTFHHASAPPPPREIPGGTSPLPYTRAFDEAWDLHGMDAESASVSP